MIVTESPAGPFAANASLVYTDILRDQDGTPVPDSALTFLTLSLVDTFTQVVINNISNQNILNQDRGTVDSGGNLTVILSPDDMSMSETVAPFIQRSMILSYGVIGGLVGAFRQDFIVRNLYAP